MHADLQRVFDFFTDDPVAIIGSAALDYDEAQDVDVLFLADDATWKAIMRRLHIRYSGWDHGGYHVRRANYRIPGVTKPVQLLSMSHLTTFADHPYAVLMRSGGILHVGERFEKMRRIPKSRRDRRTEWEWEHVEA